jgi:hypothetical protein
MIQLAPEGDPKGDPKGDLKEDPKGDPKRFMVQKMKTNVGWIYTV